MFEPVVLGSVEAGTAGWADGWAGARTPKGRCGAAPTMDGLLYWEVLSAELMGRVLSTSRLEPNDGTAQDLQSGRFV